MKLVFNSLSLKSLDSIEQVVNSLNNLFKVKKRLKEEGFIDFLFHSNIQSFPLSNNKIFIKFLEENKNDDNRDYIEYLIYHVVNVPFIDEIKKDINLEVSVRGEKFEEFRVVYEHENYILKSLFTENEWESFLVNCEVQELDENANIILKNTTLFNVGNIGNIDENTWIYQYLQKESLETFLIEVSYLEHIIISDDALSAITGYGTNIALLGALLNDLKILNKYCKEYWKFGEIRLPHIKQLGVTTIKPESEQTLNKFGDERKFIDYDGKRSKDPYSVHFNLPEEKRCYLKGFVDENDSKKIYIAYVGKHLRTVKFS